ncbi:MAG: protein TolR [Rhodocyclaceae bacterium]|nr:protein TolR [Rhodocyclaceae bacterium]
MRQRRLMNQINVVPYIDVMLVLLVIFMVTAPMIPQGTVDLPSVGKSAQPPAEPLEVIIHGDGSLAVNDRAQGGKEREIAREQLKQSIVDAQARHPGQPVLIAGDKSVRYEAVLSVMDELQKQNVAKIGLLVQPPNGPDSEKNTRR